MAAGREVIAGLKNPNTERNTVKTKIAFAGLLIFSLAIPLQASAGDEHALCRKGAKDAVLSVNNPEVEIQLKPSCWSVMVVVPDYAMAVHIFYVGKGDVKYSFPAGERFIVYDENGKAISAVIGDDKFRMKGNGKVTIRIVIPPGIRT